MLLISECWGADSSAGSSMTVHQFHNAVIWSFNDNVTGNKGGFILCSYAQSLTMARAYSKHEQAITWLCVKAAVPTRALPHS